MRLLVPFLLVLMLLGVACERQATSEGLEGARMAFTSRQWDEAERLLEGYLRRNPKGEVRWEAWCMLVDVARNVRGDERTAVDILETMHMEFNAEPARAREILTQLGELLESGRRFERAAEIWALALEIPGLEPDAKADIHRRLARLLVAQRRFTPVKEQLNACANLKGISLENRAGCLYELADLNMVTEHLDVSEELARRILNMEGLERDLQSRTAFLLADVLEQRGRHAEALARFEALRGVYPNEQVIESRIRMLRGKSSRGGKS